MLLLLLFTIINVIVTIAVIITTTNYRNTSMFYLALLGKLYYPVHEESYFNVHTRLALIMTLYHSLVTVILSEHYCYFKHYHDY